jgi:hypothetical protein
MPDDDPELPAEWLQQGWTKETAFDDADDDHSQAWGDATAQLTPADPSTAVAEGEGSHDQHEQEA